MTTWKNCGSRLLQPLVIVTKIGTKVSCHSKSSFPTPYQSSDLGRALKTHSARKIELPWEARALDGFGLKSDVWTAVSGDSVARHTVKAQLFLMIFCRSADGGGTGGEGEPGVPEID